MRISALIDRPVLLLGAGREGLAAARLLVARGHQAPLWVTGDQCPAAQADLPGLQPSAPEDLARVLRERPVVVRSPGFAPHHPLRQQIDAAGLEQTTGTCLMLAELRAAGLTVIGVTASKGKSTTSSLLLHTLLHSGVPARLLGNIGLPALAELDAVLETRPVVVLELSSYQCDDLQPGLGPQTAVFGPLFPEHLDWHGSLAAYYRAKTRLISALPPGGVALAHVAARDTLAALSLQTPFERQDISVEWVQDDGRRIGLHADAVGLHDGSTLLVPSATLRLRGQHNRENACLAFAGARRAGATVAGLTRALAEFDGLPYRLQDEGVIAGIGWINDSISTAPEAACAALEAFQGRVGTLLVGGQDRGYDYRPLLAALHRWQVQHVIVLPDSGAALAALCVPPQPFTLHQAGNLAQAVALSAQLTPRGGLCLFSPAAPSYHLWSGFEARGAEFRQHVQALTDG